MALLLELAVRHLFGGPIIDFLRTRWYRWVLAAAALGASLFLTIRIGLAGHPVYGLIGGALLFALLLALGRLLLPSLPPGARGAYTSAVTVVALLGIAIAVMSVIVVVAVMDGLQEDVRSALLRTIPHVEVLHSGPGNLENPEALEERIRGIPGVEDIFPFARATALLDIGDGIEPVPVEIMGVEPDYFASPYTPSIERGRAEDLIGEGTAIIGAELSANFLLREGDDLWVILPQGTITPVGIVPRTEAVRSAGTFRSGFYEVDSGRIYTSLDTAREILGLGRAVTGLAVMAEDPSPASCEALAERIESSSLDPIFARPWTRMRRNLYIAMETEKKTMFVVESLLILVAAFNIAGTLFMVVTKKRREIGILKSFGLAPSRILVLFAIEGFLIGGFGTLLGLAFGLGITSYLERFPLDIPGGGTVYYINYLPVAVSAPLIATTAAIALIICSAAAVYPASAAARLDPVEALREG